MTKKMCMNLSLLVLSLGVVLGFRMETAKVSYKVAKKHNILKSTRAHSHILESAYNKKIGPEAIVSRAQGMVALKSAAAKQVVMVNSRGFVFNR